jgi:hypothetical protein
MNLGTSTPVNFNLNSSNIFCEAWVYLNSFDAPSSRIIFHEGTGGLNWSFQLNSGTPFFSSWGTVSGVLTALNFSGSSSASLTTWTHVAWAYTTTGTPIVYLNGVPSIGTPLANYIIGYDSINSTFIGRNFAPFLNGYIRDLRVVQGGVVPTTSFTPLASAPFSYASPGYVANMGTTVFTLLGQFITYPSGKYGTSIYFNNKNATASGTANASTTYNISSSSITANNASYSVWIKPYYAFPVSGLGQTAFRFTDSQTVYELDFNSGVNQSQLLFYASSTPGVTITTGVNLTTQTWYHYSVVLSNVNMTASNTSVAFYFNGTQYGATSNVARTGISLIQNVVLAAGGAGGSNGFWCEIDDLRIYNTALTAAQVQSVYSSQGAPAPSRAMPLPRYAWDFNGTTTDYVSGLVPSTTGGAPIYVAGKYGQAINFPNSVNTGTTGATNYLTYTTTFNYTTGVSFFFWVNFNFGGVFAQVILETFSINIYLDQNNRLQSFDGGFLSFPATTIQVGTWYHVGLVVENGTRTAYLNGVSTTAATTQTGARSSFAIGGSPGSIYSAWCSYDDLRIFDRALTSAQVQSIYNQQGVPGRGVQVKTASAYAVSDQSQNPLTLSTYGTLVTAASSPFGGTEGCLSNCAITIPSSVSKTNFNFYASNCFAEWFFYSAGSASGYPRIFSRGQYPNEPFWIEHVSPGSNLLLSGFPFPQSYPSFTLNQWNHFSYSFNSQNSTLYYSINGTVTSNLVPTLPTHSSSDSIYINCGVAGQTDMKISNFRLVQNATTLPYITNGFTVPTAPLSIYPSGTTALLLRAVSPGIRLTGAPLFTQLSTSATSSAVGAFSLRAVNGTSARAVNVAPGGTFPPAAMSSNGPQNLTGYPFGGGGSYTASASSYGGSSFGWKVFDKDINTVWNTNYTYTGAGANSSNTYIVNTYSTTVSGSTVYGEWVQIQMPMAIYPYTYTLTPPYDAAVIQRGFPYQWTLAGSNDGAIWTTVDTQNGINTWTNLTPKTFTSASSSTAYSYYRLIVQAVNSYSTLTNQLLNISEWTVNGSNASWNTDFYADRLGNLLTAPVTGQSLASWLGGATGYVTTWYDQSGAGNHATQATAANQPIITRATKGPGYSALFNGTTNYMNFGSSTILNGTNYSVCGITRRNTSSSQKYYIGSNGAGSTRQNLAVGYFDNTTILLGEGGYATSTAVPAYSAGSEPTGFDFVMLSQTTGAYCFSWRNGTSYPGGNSGVNLPLNSAGVGIIGAVATNGSYAAYFSGEIFELIIFTASLFDLSGSSIGQLSPIPSVIQSIYNNQLGAYGT